MDATLAPASRRVHVRDDLELHIREWAGVARPFVLVHGLASNARTWDLVAKELNGLGHHVVAVDQRGHGLSDKPDHGYGFAEVTHDLASLINELDLDAPVVAGQSWGGNVVLEFATRYPESLSGLVLVDGGFIELSHGPDGTWERISVELKPPPLAGTPRAQMLERSRSFHPEWSNEQIEMQLANFETLLDGTIRPWLTLERHMMILRALWEQHPSQLYPHVQAPALVAVADRGAPSWRRQEALHQLETLMPRARVQVFPNSVHDMHVDQPVELASWMLEALDEGYFG